MRAGADIRDGYLLIADITGFTSYLAAAELEHAQAVMGQVLRRLAADLAPPARLAEIEGDAVFVHLPTEEADRGELVPELVDSAYAGFRDLRSTMVRNATCPCRACRAIPDLDLKFVVHHGRYAMQSLGDRLKPVGTDVNLAHRLLKNRVAAETGWGAYALYTRDALQRIGLREDDLHGSFEEYPHLGRVPVFAADLGRAYECRRRGKRVYIGAGDADAEVTHRFSVHPAVLWDWLNDPAKRNRWMERANWSAEERPRGRLGPGASNHCSNFRVIEQVLDLRPFDYYTVRFVASWIRVLATVELEGSDGGTRVHWRMRVASPVPRWLGGLLARLIVTRRMKLKEGFFALEEILLSRPG